MFIMLCTAFRKPSPAAADPAVSYRRADRDSNMCSLVVCLLFGCLMVEMGSFRLHDRHIFRAQ
jgi:hypothetical protein